MFFPKTYPIISAAQLPDVDPKTGDRRVRGRIKESDLPQVTQHESLELAAGHSPGIELMEIERADGTVYYEAVTGPNCFHKCAACRGDVDGETREFGKGAIGLFGDSSGGEMERLRRELRLMAESMTKGMATLGGAIESIQARLPAETTQAALPEKVDE